MKQIPPEIGAHYQAHLNHKAIPEREFLNYKKWLRYYLDFCFKYNYNHLNEDSVKLFIEKLKEKGQNSQQQKQAFHAVSLYYELGLIDDGKDGLLENKDEKLSIQKENNLKGSGADWVPAYDQLTSIMCFYIIGHEHTNGTYVFVPQTFPLSFRQIISITNSSILLFLY